MHALNQAKVPEYINEADNRQDYMLKLPICLALPGLMTNASIPSSRSSFKAAVRGISCSDVSEVAVTVVHSFNSASTHKHISNQPSTTLTYW